MRNSAQPIAIIGVACRTPGANNPEEFWHLLSTGQDQISTLSLQRWSLARPSLSSQTLEKVRQESPVCWGGFLNQVEQFDPAFFGISAREAVSMSPQHRLLLEVAWEALEDAALRPDQLTKTNTGVFLGLTSCDYSHLAWKSHSLDDPYLTTGTNSSIAASRISYLLNLSGPSVVVDTACSSSLVAIHLACQSIQAGESTMAFAGGVNLALNPDVMFNLASGGFQAPDGRCKTFDSRADGYVRGEGVGLVLLKPLDQALADGDPIQALILGSAVNQDGRTQGITAPKPTAQEAVVRQAYKQAGVSPGQVQYVETHGTGTKLGDPIELAALGKVLKDGRNPDDVCLVGAVKTNIGHLEAAAGIAGLIKVVLSLRHRQIPPNLHFQSPNPYIPFDKLPVEVPQSLTAWPSYGDDAIASVSAFSFGGTNAHVVLQAAPKLEESVIQIERPQHLLTLSAKSPTALKASVQRYQNHLQHHAEQSLGNICYTANIGRAHHDYRLAIVSTSQTDLMEKLKAFELGDNNSSVFEGQRANSQSNIAFLFTGQGSQYVDMGRELYETQLTFGRVLDQCADILREVNVPLLEVLYDQAEGNGQKINNTAYAQPALFALEYALYKLWQSWGIKPSVVMGHSVGEYVAACVAGVFSLEDGLKLSAARGRLMQQLPTGGGMVSLMASVEQVKTAIADQPDVTIAAINGPQSTVISGPITVLQTMVEQFARNGIKGKFLSVSHAFHSPLMEPMLAEFEQVAQQISYSQSKLKLISNVTGQVATEAVATPEYWCDHILAPVNFAAGMERLQQEEIDIFLECGPQPILLGMGRQCLPEDGEKVWLPSLRPGQNDWQQMLTSLGELYARGASIDWVGFDKDYPQRCKVSLPTYPFQRQRYWIDVVKQHRLPGQVVHPLLGVKTELAGGETLYSQQFEPHEGWLADHQVYQTTIMPGAGFAALALASQQGPTQLDEVVFEQPMLVSESCELQLRLEALDDSKQQRFTLYSRKLSQADSWQLHSHGRIGPASQSSEYIDIERLQSHLQSRSVHQMYEQLGTMGLVLGPTFREIQQLWGGANEALAELVLPEVLVTAEKIEPIHPAMLDACSQTIFGAIDESLDEVLYLPLRYRQLELFRSAVSHLFCYAQIVEFDTTTQTITSNLTFVDKHGEIFGGIQGFVIKRASRNAMLREQVQSATHLLYETQWQPVVLTETANPEIARDRWPILGEDEYQDVTDQAAIVQTATAQSGTWLLFVPNQGSSLGDHLAAVLTAQGYETIQVSPGNTFQQLDVGHYQLNPTAPEQFQQFLQGFAHHPPRGIVHLWSLDTHLENVARAQELSCGSTLHLLQAIHSIFKVDVPRLWLVTQGAQGLGDEPQLQPQQTCLWGLGRSIALEYPQLKCVCLDLEPGAEETLTLQSLVQTLQTTDEENQVAYRHGKRYVARLSKLKLRTDASAVVIRSEGSYCITGGLGSLGLRVGQWLANQGAQQLVLVGRNHPSKAAQAAIARMEATGATVTVIQADIGNFAAAKGVFVQLKAAHMPLRGVIHAAGVLDSCFLQQQTWERFVDVMHPKVQGTWNLHCLTQDLNLDFFVCFSSIIALLGTSGQGNYAAANVFMDALMQHRRNLGLPGLSLNWGPWADSGMFAQLDPQTQNQIHEHGFKAFETGPGLQALAQALAEDKAQIGVFAVDWIQFMKQFDGQAIPPALTELAEELALTAQQGPRLEEFIEHLQQTDHHQRQLQLVDYLTGIVTTILRRSPSDRPHAREGFFNLGMDSLMAMELVTTIQRDLGLKLAGTVAFEYANIEELARYLAACLSSTQQIHPKKTNGELETDSMTEIRQLPVQELQRSLLHELDQLETALQLPKH